MQAGDAGGGKLVALHVATCLDVRAAGLAVRGGRVEAADDQRLACRGGRTTCVVQAHARRSSQPCKGGAHLCMLQAPHDSYLTRPPCALHLRFQLLHAQQALRVDARRRLRHWQGLWRRGGARLDLGTLGGFVPAGPTCVRQPRARTPQQAQQQQGAHPPRRPQRRRRRRAAPPHPLQQQQQQRGRGAALRLATGHTHACAQLQRQGRAPS